jgi:hypothetical protein
MAVLPHQQLSSASVDSISHRRIAFTAERASTETPSRSKLPTKATPTAKKPKKKNKAELAAEKLEELLKYANNLFAELNRTVFRDGLPDNTELKWSNTLRTTAGKAHWHRSVSLVLSVRGKETD